MVDTGAAATVVSRQWCKAHGILVGGNKPTFSAANWTPLNIVGTVGFTICLSLTLEMDLEGVAV